MTPQEHLAEAEKILGKAAGMLEAEESDYLSAPRARGVEMMLSFANAHTAIAHAQYAGAAVRGDR